jgi:hypothetical protein
MNLPEYTGEATAMLTRLTTFESDMALWRWSSLLTPLPGDLDTITHLVSMGYEQVSESQQQQVTYLASQCCDIACTYNNGLFQMWARSEDKTRPPVTLAAPANEYNPQQIEIPMLQFLPSPRTGQWAVVSENDRSEIYHISQLPEKALALQKSLRQTLIELGGNSEWISHTEFHPLGASELHYQRLMTDLRSVVLRTRGKKQETAKQRIVKLEQAHNDIVKLRQSWLKADWLAQWAEVRCMAQQLADDYYQYHRKVTQEHRTHTAPVTTLQKTMLPSNNAFRGIEQGFGTAIIKNSLWGDKADEHQIVTPNGSLLKIRGQQDFERKALTQYINELIGVEGLKHMLILLDTYYVQTGAKDRRDDARISIRQLLIRMGYSETQADDINERRKLAHTILYLARTWVTSSEIRYEQEEGPRGGKRPGQKRRRGVDWTPLLVIEEMRSSEDGGLETPDEVGFHLGKDFYNSMFGEGKHFFYLPTAQVLSYHAEREQQELCLAFYLSNMIFVQQRFTIHFRELALQSGLMTEEEIDHDDHRTRTAMRIVYALERLEKDGVVKHGPHDALDIPLAVDLITGKCKEDSLSPTTLLRIKKSYGYLRGKSEKDLREAKRKGLQRLLREKEKDAIAFGAGHLMIEKVEHREQQREQAIELNEQAMVARIIKSASKQVKGRVVDGSIEK